MWRVPSRSRLALRKIRQTEHIPAGDPSDGTDCACASYLLTEDSEPLLAEDLQPLIPEG